MVDTKLSRLSMTSTLPASWRAVISLLEEGGGRERDAKLISMLHLSSHETIIRLFHFMPGN